MGWKLSVGDCTVVVVRTGFRFGEWGEKQERKNTDIEKRGGRKRGEEGAGENKMATRE